MIESGTLIKDEKWKYWEPPWRLRKTTAIREQCLNEGAVGTFIKNSYFAYFRRYTARHLSGEERWAAAARARHLCGALATRGRAVRPRTTNVSADGPATDGDTRAAVDRTWRSARRRGRVVRVRVGQWESASRTRREPPPPMLRTTMTTSRRRRHFLRALPADNTRRPAGRSTADATTLLPSAMVFGLAVTRRGSLHTTHSSSSLPTQRFRHHFFFLVSLFSRLSIFLSHSGARARAPTSSSRPTRRPVRIGEHFFFHLFLRCCTPAGSLQLRRVRFKFFASFLQKIFSVSLFFFYLLSLQPLRRVTTFLSRSDTSVSRRRRRRVVVV